jgi:uncharacterized protein (TIGR02145 family)
MKKIVFITAMLMLGFWSCKKDSKPLPDGSTGTVSDVEGNVYKTVKIGDQWWMAENLKTTKLNDGTVIPVVELQTTWANSQSQEPMMCYYNNDLANKNTYGGLYNWYAVNTGKLAPTGWHVPTDADWQKLQDYLIANGYNYDGTKSGNKIAKSLASTSGWIDDPTLGNVGNDQASNNKSGLNIMSVGGRSESSTFYPTIGDGQAIWTSSIYDSSNAKSVQLLADDYRPYGGYGSKRIGLPIRCVKD